MVNVIRADMEGDEMVNVIRAGISLHITTVEGKSK